MAEVRCPVLIMGGGQDYHTTVEETRQMYEACQTDRELYVFEHLSHQDFFLHEPAQYRSVLMRFLDQHFPVR